MTLLALEGDRLYATTHCDPEMALFADRHYSRKKIGSPQFMPPGRKLVLRNAEGTILFGWLWAKDEYRLDHQTGYNCTIFRNESDRKSSEIIIEAENLAVEKWGLNRFYTYVNAKKIRSSNPGYCFIRAGYKKIGVSKAGLILLAKESTP